jgi:hypothetical protein
LILVGRRNTLATYEFISLRCIAQNELGGDEIFVEYVGEQVFPAEGFQAKFATGDAVVNLDSVLEDSDRSKYLEASGAHPVEPYDGVDDFLRFHIPDHGLVVQVWEHDLLSPNDLMGKIVVFPTRTKGPVTKRLDKSVTGIYELTYQVY